MMAFKRPSTTPFPDDLVDVYLPDLDPSSVVVLLYILRHTMGWKKESDHISQEQFLHGITRHDGRPLDRGTGLSRNTLRKALRQLEEMDLIRREQRLSPRGDKETTLYSVAWQDDVVPYIGRPRVPRQELTEGGAIPDPPVGQKMPPQQRRSQQTQHNRMRAPTAPHTPFDYARSSYVCSGCGSNRCRPSCAAQECPDRRASGPQQ